jgi:uncharacterized OsmC-like protein
MTGTFGGALEARGIPAGDGYLSSDTVGEVEKDGRVLIIRRIHVTYSLKIDPALRREKQDAIDRVMEVHHDACPVYRSISPAIPITASLEYV